ncbi:hypothetical protein CAFE_29000 [Caprobacter fermentans]|uniref:Uncharacterized protein n=1 Tax=Caproicibacter fermentans TaxID=2576756 RepID=A0A6N8I2K8_9FIRM|nr:hypothetical protein [Caproicibacter fermentans]MVB12168.1 hypothetical protein [Caproicibacter fermentans]OCN01182.1 hypothetical protein A7X67_07370 [Clostridium sp. W14A]QNK39594.1 hypothetical protein HCR03_12715 [Caproicibacter fermentans]
MSRQEKVLSIFIILTMLTLWSSLSVFAQSGQSEPYFPDLDSSQAESVPPSSAAPPSSKPSAPESKAPGSSMASSSKPVKQTGKRASSSASFSSGASSGPASGVDSGDALGGISSLPVSSEISLPSVGSVSENDPLNSVVTNTESSRRLNWIGILSWACIALGVLVVLIVVFSNRRPPRGMGRKRYRRPKRSRKKRLLNDKYYRHINRY